MTSLLEILLILFLLLGVAPGPGRAEKEGLALAGDTYTLTFSSANGSILALHHNGRPGSLLHSGEQGLWHVRFRDGSEINAAHFDAHSLTRPFRYAIPVPGKVLRLEFRSAEIAVIVTVTARSDGVDFAAQVEPQEKIVLDFALPARLRFNPEALDRFICPTDGNQSVGAAFQRAFFQRQPQERPSGWQPQMVGAQGYLSLYGSLPDQRPDNDPPVALQVTAAGREWCGTELAARVEGSQAVVNRPPTRAQADLILVDSSNGPYFSACRLGGSGYLWRLGGGLGEGVKQNAVDLVMAALERLAAVSPPGRNRLGLLALRKGPEWGGWTAVPVSEWRNRLRRLPAVQDGKIQAVELTTPLEMMDALQSNDFLALVNPYGEWMPAPENGGLTAAVQAVGEYVRAGGNWFEVAGFPFFYALKPIRYLHYSTPYPAGFADFFHLDTSVGSASVYRVQPLTGESWEEAKKTEALFVPGQLACGGDEQGGYCDRSFVTYVAPGESWRCPTVRLTVGAPVPESLRSYCEANGINRKLADKMPPDLLEKFKNAVLVYYGGNCREKSAYLDRLPVPTLIHFADYLQGGFDKQYPDHLPPRPDFGTPEEFRAFLDQCHQRGHLVMPYTNPTWWCDHPRGPTFVREGEAPLLRTLDGTLAYERYGSNDGFTVCHWHPAVQAANRLTVRQFTDEFPVDLLFQDQCGARSWAYDTNPASPTPYAYSAGLLAMVAEDCQTKPLSTESGWDRVVNYESQLCGMSWALVPTEAAPAWRRLMKFDVPPETWEVFPLAQYIAHDKTAMLYHDLGQFVTNREVLAWTLGLGFSMSYRIGAAELAEDGPREWLRWLDRLQKAICARYVGEPVGAFAHDRGPAPTVEDDGILRATYGPVRVVANLGPKSCVEGGHQLSPFGFYATAPGVVAANLQNLGGNDFGNEGVSFVAEGDSHGAEIWVYAAPEQEVAVELPAEMVGPISLALDGFPATGKALSQGVLPFRLPERTGEEDAGNKHPGTRFLWHGVVTAGKP